MIDATERLEIYYQRGQRGRFIGRCGYGGAAEKGISFYDIFGPVGIYEDKIFIRAEPQKLKPLFFKAGFLYCIDTDGEGLQRVRRSKVVFH